MKQGSLKQSPPALTANALIIAVAAFILLSGNATFVGNLLRTYPPGPANALPLLSLAPVFGGLTVLMLAPLCFGRAVRPLLAGVLLSASVAAYFMDTYGVIISDDMMRNVTHTNSAEAFDLFSVRMLAYVLLLGALPAVAVMKVKLVEQGGRAALLSRLKLMSGALALVIAPVLAFGGFYASFFRVNKELRQHANPVYFLYSTVKFAAQSVTAGNAGAMKPIGTDAVIPPTDVTRDLVIMVVGETARADRFSLNGYPRDTNPLLGRLNVISFTNFRACGTSTAVSVPCMFLLDGETKGATTIKQEENLLDVLQRSGANVLWLDNNSDSKGVAGRVAFEDYRTPANNPVCDSECRDEGMLARLQEYIDLHPRGDIFIVLHQMGNHGPAYFKRYPPQFEKFRPVCRESDLSLCSREEIGNAYDNAILYTDYFLSRVIGLLKNNDNAFETAMFYVSDHGESLGENGVYLHGLPKAIAPEAQLHVPAIMWFGSRFHAVDLPALRRKTAMHFTHNSVFHTILGFFEIESATYVPELDMLDQAKPKVRP